MAELDVRTGLLGAVAALTGAIACENGDPCDGEPVNRPPEPDPDPNPNKPSILSGEWLDGGVLELRFSEPIYSIGDLDPARFAIIGWDATSSAYYYDAKECSPQTSYRELGAGSSYYFNTNTGIADAWIGPEDPTLLRIRPITGAQCRVSQNSRATGVFLVYTDRFDAGPALIDEADVALDDIGPQWAIDRLEACSLDDDDYGCYAINYFNSGTLSGFDVLLDIPCP